MAITSLGLTPQEVLVIGDGLSGDMNATRNAGVVHLIWIPGPWGAYDTTKQIPEGTIEVNNIGNVITTLLARS